MDEFLSRVPMPHHREVRVRVRVRVRVEVKGVTGCGQGVRRVHEVARGVQRVLVDRGRSVYVCV